VVRGDVTTLRIEGVTSPSAIKRVDAKSHSWTTVAKLGYAYKGSVLELAVPRKLLGLHSSSTTFDFHWCDNPADLKDPISLCINGDSAPNRRFNYRCTWRE
jgi:hypothetical protein